MHFIHSYLIITIIFPLIIYSTDRDLVHHNDLYFEVVEPSDINYTFRCRRAKNFGTKFDHVLKNIYLIPTKPLEACDRLKNRFEIKGNIAFSERGSCSFVTKIINAQESGALGIIIMDNDRTADDHFIDMIDDMSQRTVHIPAMFLQYRDGHIILNSIEKNNLIGARINIPLNLTYNEMLKAQRAPGSYWL